MPIRDLFDADLDRARREPGCVLCRLVREHDEQLMRSLLWEYCTDADVSSRVSTSWGYCPYHTWTLAVVEREHLGDELGITILYQALLKQLLRLLERGSPPSSLIPPLGPAMGSANCRFCQLAQREEQLFLSRLTARFEKLAEGGGEQQLRTELCFPHIRHLLETYQAPSDHQTLLQVLSHRTSRVAGRQLDKESAALATRLVQYTLPRLADAFDTMPEPRLDWSHLTRTLAFLVGQREALPLIHKAANGQSIRILTPLLIITSKRGHFQRPTREACPVCAAISSAILTQCAGEISTGKMTSSSSALCLNHHWLFAAAVLRRQDEAARQYESWLKEQYFLAQQQRTVSAYADSSSEQRCRACVYGERAALLAVASFIERLREINESKEEQSGGLLCLFHWRHVQQQCAQEADASALQERLLAMQQRHLMQLDSAVEAYLARFSASKRERGEVPDIQGAAWAWESLLALFAGEPGLIEGV